MTADIRKIENDTEIDRLFNRTFASSFRPNGFVEVGEDNFCVPSMYTDYEEKIRKFEVRNDDIFIAGHMKTGTTWLQEMVWLIVNNFDYKEAETNNLLRVPYFELPVYMDVKVVDVQQLFYGGSWESLPNYPGPRCFRTHLHWSFLPEQIRNGTKKPKIISTLRNPHDTFISYYHHCRSMEGFKGTFEEMTKLFLSGRTLFGPYWKSVMSFWEQRHRPYVLFVKFKEMKDDLPAAIKKVANFLEKPVNDEQVHKLAKHLHFDSMKKNTSLNMKGIKDVFHKKFDMIIKDSDFVRSGKEGGYKEEMTSELIEIFDKWQAENLRGTELNFD